MNDLALNAGGLRLHWTVLLLGVAALQWLVFVLISMASRAKMPKRGWRASEKNLIVSTLAVAAAYGFVFHAETLLPKSKPKVEHAAVMSTGSGASCASVEVGMGAERVRAKLGQPSETRNDEKTRGPGAATWIYADSRCAVHLIDDKVDMIE